MKDICATQAGICSGGLEPRPWQEGDVKMIEKLQERMIRMLSDVRGKTYEEKVADAGLTTLRERRVRGDAIETSKTMNGFNRVDKKKLVFGDTRGRKGN